MSEKLEAKAAEQSESKNEVKAEPKVESKAEVSTDQTTATTTSTTNNQQAPDVRQIAAYSLEDTLRAVYEYYNSAHKNIECIMPPQLVDGGVVDFVDRDKDTIIATARMRFINTSYVVNNSVYVEVKFSSLSFTRQRHTIKLQLVESK